MAAEEDINHHMNAAMVVIDVYPQMIREMIVNHIPPKTVLMLIQNDADKILMKNITSRQKDMILKLDTAGYNALDLSCLYKLVRHCKLLKPPKQGWDKTPKPEDQSEGDDVERMKKIRNDIFHRPRGGLSESERNNFFQQSIEIATRVDIRIGSPSNGFKRKIEEIKSEIVRTVNPVVRTVSPEKYMEFLENFAECREKLQEKERPCVILYYANSVAKKIGSQHDQDIKKKDVTVALIKPDVVEAGKVNQMLKDIREAGIEILRNEERMLTEDEIRHQVYSYLENQVFFEDMVQFMTRSPSFVLALTRGKTGENIIENFRDLIGPTDVDEAKTLKPDSLRAKYGQTSFRNAVHGSSSLEMAKRDLHLFFPDFVAPDVEDKAAKIQTTLALVRPKAVPYKDTILAKIRDSGFKVAMQKEIQMSIEMVKDFYKGHKGQDYYDQLIEHMSSGPVLALGLIRENAVEGWRNMLGPKEVSIAKEKAPESLRAQFAEDDAINSLHGSDSEETAEKEIQLFFPTEQTIAVIKPDAIRNKKEIVARISEAGFRIAITKTTKLPEDVAKKFYANCENKDYYIDLIEHIKSGEAYFIGMCREGAIEGWRSMIGPSDPAKAKKDAPDSIRAIYGESIIKNAVHGSSDPEHAKRSIKTIFGDRSSSCTIVLRDLDFDDEAVMQIKKLTLGNICTEDIELMGIEQGSIILHVRIPDWCFMSTEILHERIHIFLHQFLLLASIPFMHGHFFTVVLAESDDLVSDIELTKQGDIDYLKEQQSPYLKLNVKVKDSAFQNENVLYREVNRFVSGVYNTLDRYTNSLNGSSREVLMLAANECDENCTPSLKVIEDPPQLRTAQVPVIGEEDSNYFKISTLLLRIAPRAVKIKFDDEFRPEVLTETLNSNKSVIADMKNKRLINQVQWNSMFPRKGDPVSKLFNTTLMICLLGNLKGIKMSNELPHHTDYSVGAYLSRINIYRKDIANSNYDKIKNKKFAACWSDTETAVVRLSGGKLKEECSNLKTKSYVCADRKTTLNNIQAGKRLVQIEIAERVEKLDNNQDSIIKETQEWEEESKWFVQTKAFNFIIRHVDQRVLTVVGNQGMGKSMLLHQTALFLKMKKGYSIFSCHGPSALVSQHRANTKQVFILDDACGQFTLVQSNVEQWKQYETRIARILESETVIIISSCRSNMFIDQQCQSLFIFSGCRCDLNDGDYAIDTQEKIKIAKNYTLSQQTISEVQTDLDSFDMFPLLCRLYTERVAWNAINFFHDPFSFYKEELDGFYKEDGRIRWCSLFLCFIHNGCLDQTMLMDESESVFWPKCKIIFAELGIKPDLSRKSVLDTLDTLVNIYLKKIDDEFHILHDVLFDFLCYYFGQHHQRLMINYVDSRFIRDRTALKTLQTSPQEFTILIDRENEDDYFQRLVKDMLSGDLDDVLYNNQIRYKDFRLKLLAHLQKLDDDDLTVTNVFSDIVIDENEKPSQLIPVDFACKYGYTELFEFFLSKTKNINAYEGNNIPLITACRKGDEHMTCLLLEKGADVNQTDSLGCSPLLWSCVYWNISIIKILLNKGADINNIEVCSKSSPLIWPCLGEFLYLNDSASITKNDINEHIFTIEHIIHTFLTVLQNGYSRGCIIANETCVYGKAPGLLSSVQTILQKIYRGDMEVNPDVRFRYNTTDQISPSIEIMNLLFDTGVAIEKCSIGGISALSFACMIDINNSQSVRYILSKGGKVNTYDNEGKCPLHIALRLGKEGLIKLLIDNGANVNLLVDGISLIDWAIGIKNISISDCLIKAGASINHCYENGSTLLHCAITFRDEKLIRSLLKRGISVHCKNYSGDTPLMIAVNLGLVNVVAILIKEGAGVDITNSKGISPLMIASAKGDADIVKIILREKLQFNKNRTVDCLFSACRNDHVEVVGLLLEKGYDVNITEPKNGNTCLLESSRDGYTSMVSLLLDKDANVNASNRDGDTPLIISSKNGHTAIVRLLVAKGACMYTSNEKGESSPIVACINNHLEVMKVLIDNGCNIDCIEKKSKQTWLSVACYHGYDKIVAYLVEHGANVNTKNHIRNTPLKLAATKCHFNIVKMLVEHKADINIRNDEGSASISGACYHDNGEIVTYLIKHGANVDTQDNNGNTPLILAASKGYFNMVKMLIENEADVDIKNEEGFTCVSVASYHGYCKILTYLIEHGGGVNTQNKRGNTALMIAASKGRFNIVQILIKNGAEIYIRNETGSTSVELASYKYNGKILKYLIEHGGSVNYQNKRGNTPLMIAASKGRLYIVHILIEHGADINIRNKEGSTCLSFASEKGFDNTVMFFLYKGACINSANNNGDSPLMLALQNNHVSTAKLLINFGANVNMKNKEGLPPLHFARQNELYDIEDFLGKTLQKEFHRNARHLIFITFVIFIAWLYFTTYYVMLYAEL